MNKKLKYAFIVHICKYLGIALMSGSIVHAGTLGGSTLKYSALVFIGIILTVTGNYLEHKIENLKIDFNFIALAVFLSFGTGMISGGVQHYSDNPAYGSILLSVGLLLTFVSLAYKDFSNVVSKKAISVIAVISVMLYLFLSTVVPPIIGETSSDGHHDETETLK